MLQLFAFTPEPAHVIEMAFAIVLIHRANSADQRFFDRANADKSQNIALEDSSGCERRNTSDRSRPACPWSQRHAPTFR